MPRTRLLTLLAASASVLSAQNSNPLSAEARQAYTTVKNYVLQSAQKMPEENYAFKPAPRVRTFGQILGHIAEEQYIYCGAAKGEEKAVDVEKTKTSKRDLIEALKESFAYCDTAYDPQTDASAVEIVKRGERSHTRLWVLWGNIIHDNQHYGNLVTYLRIKGIVPPSTEGQ